MSYDYKAGKKRINEILNSTNEIEQLTNIPSISNFNYDNGIMAPVASIFVDIRDSSTYFTKQPKKQVAKMIRSYISELVDIFNNNEYVREIGIRGDCVYAIYNAPDEESYKSIISDAATANTMIKMLNELLNKKSFETINVGVGVGYDANQLVIKAGRKGSGINDFVWIGNAIIDASNCCSIANCYPRCELVISSDFYVKIKNLQANDDEKYSDLFRYFKTSTDCGYECNLISIRFNEWIEKGMSD